MGNRFNDELLNKNWATRKPKIHNDPNQQYLDELEDKAKPVFLGEINGELVYREAESKKGPDASIQRDEIPTEYYIPPVPDEERAIEPKPARRTHKSTTGKAGTGKSSRSHRGKS